MFGYQWVRPFCNILKWSWSAVQVYRRSFRLFFPLLWLQFTNFPMYSCTWLHIGQCGLQKGVKWTKKRQNEFCRSNRIWKKQAKTTQNRIWITFLLIICLVVKLELKCYFNVGQTVLSLILFQTFLYETGTNWYQNCIKKILFNTGSWLNFLFFIDAGS